MCIWCLLWRTWCKGVCVLGVPNSHAYGSAPYLRLLLPPLDSMDCGCRLLVDEATLNLYM